MKAKTLYLITGFFCVSCFQTLDIIFNQHLPGIGFVPFWIFNILYLVLDIAFLIRIGKYIYGRHKTYKRRQVFFSEVLKYA